MKKTLNGVETDDQVIVIENKGKTQMTTIFLSPGEDYMAEETQKMVSDEIDRLGPYASVAYYVD